MNSPSRQEGEFIFRLPDNLPDQAQREPLADHRKRLQQCPLRDGKPVDAGGKHPFFVGICKLGSVSSIW
ncbi:hypothetical protein D3C87_1759310 [compost metagenome]